MPALRDKLMAIDFKIIFLGGGEIAVGEGGGGLSKKKMRLEL